MDEDVFIEKISDSVFFVKLQKEVYEKKAVMRTANDYTDRCHIKIEEVDFEHVGVWLKLKYEINPSKAEYMLGEFCNDVLDAQIRLDLEDKFGNLREMIYKKAFAAAGGVDG